MPRPLLDRLHDLEHALKLDGWTHFAVDIREAIEELQRREELMQTVDIQLDARRSDLG